MPLHKINEADRLYVLNEPSLGVTCLGFEVAARQSAAVAAWAGLPAPTAPIGTAEAYAEYERIMDAGAEYAARTGRRCDAELVPQLVGLEGRRVEVTEGDGTRRRFIVGKSTGWMPIHLEIHNRRSHCGTRVTGAPFASVVTVNEPRRGRR